MKLKAVPSALLLSASLFIIPASYAALPTAAMTQEVPSLSPMLSKVTPAVVSVAVEGTHNSQNEVPEMFRYFFGQNAPQNRQKRPFKGLGSGVIIDAEKGYIVTNNHVIESADKIEIGLNDGREIEAKLVGTDPEADIALLKIDANNLTALALADSDKAKVGDFTVAIGNPFGLGQTVTSGIVSALGRSGLGIEMLENFIQTDAAINSGNSGGALVNFNGDLIGINTAIVAPSGGNVGIGFAIPSNMVKNLVDQLIVHGEVKRGMLGVLGHDLTKELAQGFGLDNQYGAFINEVMPDSAAAKAGLKAGDIIVNVDGKDIKNFNEVRAKISSKGVGAEVKLIVIRDKDKLNFTVKLGERTEFETPAASIHPALAGAKLKDGEHGVEIISVADNSNAARAGLKKGDIITGLNRTLINNIQTLKSLLKQSDKGVALKILRGSSQLYLILR